MRRRDVERPMYMFVWFGLLAYFGVLGFCAAMNWWGVMPYAAGVFCALGLVLVIWYVGFGEHHP